MSVEVKRVTTRQLESGDVILGAFNDEGYRIPVTYVGPLQSGQHQVTLAGLQSIHATPQKEWTVERRKPERTFPNGTVAKVKGHLVVKVHGKWDDANDKGEYAHVTDKIVDQNPFYRVLFEPGVDE